MRAIRLPRVMPLTTALLLVGCEAPTGVARKAVQNPAPSLQNILGTATQNAQSLTLLSAPPGLPEGTLVDGPFIIAIDGVPLPSPAPAVVTHTESWALSLPGASYVSNCPTCGSDLARCGGGFTPECPRTMTFVQYFELPAGFINPALLMTTTNDDAANVFLNGTFIGRARTCCGPIPGQLVATLGITDPSVFQVGTNEIRYELENFNAPCPLSMAYVATVTFDLVQTVGIDVKPGSFPSPINPTSMGTIPVAVLSAPGFDAPSQVDVASLTFGRTGTEASLAFCDSSPQDVNRDGLLDMVCHFRTQLTAFQTGGTQAVLKGTTVTGMPIQGTDSVVIVPQR